MTLFLLYEYGFILVCNLSLFELTEWEPCMWLLNTDFFAGNAANRLGQLDFFSFSKLD